MKRRMRTRSSAFFSALALVGLASAGCGKGAKGDCPQLDICGNSPVGKWIVASFCQQPVVRPSQPNDVNDFIMMNPPLAPTVAPPQPNPVVSTQTTSGDWCSSLVYTQNDTVSNASLWHDSPEISDDPMEPSTIKFYGDDHSYITQLFLRVPYGQNYTHFAQRCLFANGAAKPTCAKLAAGLNDFYKPLMASVPRTFKNIMCFDASDSGCDCTYEFTLEVDDSGNWATDPNDPTVLVQDSTVLTFNGFQMNAQASTTTLRSSFCAEGGQLELSGLRGGSLSNVQGLRTLGLVPTSM
jgi:hypothetical protein